MNIDNLLEHSCETHQIEAFYNALKSVGDMDSKALRGEGWFDDLYDTEHGLNFNELDESWLDDLDEAA